MGGVDKSNMNLALYRSKFRSRKWSHQIASHIINKCAVNAWVIYHQIESQSSYFDFLSEIASVLLCNSKCINGTDESHTEVAPPNPKKMRAINIPYKKRYDKCGHWAILMEVPNAQRCKMQRCKKRKCLLAVNTIFIFASLKGHAFWHFMESNCKLKISIELCLQRNICKDIEPRSTSGDISLFLGRNEKLWGNFFLIFFIYHTSTMSSELDKIYPWTGTKFNHETMHK